MIIQRIDEIDRESFHEIIYSGLIIRTDEGDIYALCEVYYCEDAGVVLIEEDFDISKHREDGTYDFVLDSLIGEEIIRIEKNKDEKSDAKLDTASLRIEFRDDSPLNLVIYQYENGSPDMKCILGISGKEVRNYIGDYRWTPEQRKCLSWHAPE